MVEKWLELGSAATIWLGAIGVYCMTMRPKGARMRRRYAWTRTVVRILAVGAGILASILGVAWVVVDIPPHTASRIALNVLVDLGMLGAIASMKELSTRIPDERLERLLVFLFWFYGAVAVIGHAIAIVLAVVGPLEVLRMTTTPMGYVLRTCVALTSLAFRPGLLIAVVLLALRIMRVFRRALG
jgi:hypothetical protein